MRVTWDEYFMAFAHLAATRATCLRRKVGAVVVRNHHILSTGYNGPPKGAPHCKTCLRKELGVPSGERNEICRASHAEQNAVAQAAQHGVKLNEATLYCTNYPCGMCAKSIVNAGIREVVYANHYNDDVAKWVFRHCGTNLRNVACPEISIP